jgi:hypothetical protein
MKRSLLAFPALVTVALVFAACEQDYVIDPGLYAYASREVSADTCHLDLLLADDGAHFTIVKDGESYQMVPGNGGPLLACEPGPAAFSCDRDVDELSVPLTDDPGGPASEIAVRQTVDFLEQFMDTGHTVDGTIKGHVECASDDGCKGLLDLGAKLPCDYTIRFQADATN